MAESEAKEVLEKLGGYCSSTDEYAACKLAIKALEEVQQYRKIGTPEECRAAVEKQTAKKPDYDAEDMQDVIYVLRDYPIAYDPDKVIRQIKELSIRERGEIKTEDVITIVKGGGVDE